MTVETRLDEPRGQFPVGMRVLAVDDDPTCLFVLENLLRKCQYHVTATNQAITALKMLRENKNKFDLVISDVHMPDMDGFKLLELVGLEMDLPVIMLSANGDTKLVMKGITHGACDYLLKPVRIEELKNIWQHVIRRKKFDSKEKNNTCNQDQPNSGSNNGIGSAGAGNSDQNGKLTKKRKDQDDEDDEDHENGHDNDDPSAQKKPRVVWSVELHRKFVAAVNQLGIDKAVPKKILDLMNVEKLTRENVASHLQKYRLYLKRISCVANQQANMVAALGSADPSYLRVGSLSGIKHLQPLNGSGQFQNNIFRSHIPYSGMIGRLNTPAGLGVNGLPSSGILQLGHAQNLNSSMNDPLKFQPPIAHHLNHTGGTIQGMPVSMGLELDQLHPNKVVSSVQAPPTAGFDDKTIPPPISNNNVPPDPRASRVASSCSRTPLVGITNNNALMLEPVSQDKQRGRGFENNLASVASSQHSEFPLPLLDNHNPNGSRCSDTWASAVQSSGMHANSYSTTNECFHVGNPSGGASSITSLSSQSHDSMADMHSQGPIFTNHTQNVAYQGWDDPPLESLIPANGVHGPSGFHRNLDFNFGNTLEMKHEGVTKPPENNSLKSDQGYIMETQKLQRNRISNNLGSLEDLVSAMMKQEQDKVRLVNGNFICDDFSGGTSI